MTSIILVRDIWLANTKKRAQVKTTYRGSRANSLSAKQRCVAIEPSVRRFVDRPCRERGTAVTDAAPIVIDSYALSPTQAGMLYHAISEARTGVDIEQIVITLREHIDESLFVRAWGEVVQRHAILRTRFRWEGIPEFQQEVVEYARLPVTSVDWSLLETAEQQRQMAAQLAADRREDFDLTLAPAMRLFIARTGSDACQVIWTFHHALLDAISSGRIFSTCALMNAAASVLASARAAFGVTSPATVAPPAIRNLRRSGVMLHLR